MQKILEGKDSSDTNVDKQLKDKFPNKLPKKVINLIFLFQNNHLKKKS